MMKSFGDRAYMLLVTKNRIAGVIGWQVENLVSTVDELLLNKTALGDKVLKKTFEKIE